LQKDTVLIKDERTGEEVSKAYNTQVEAKLTNPSETALYRVLVKPGEFQKMLVIMNGLSNGGSEGMATVVRLEGNGSGSNKSWLNTHPMNVFADQISEQDEWDKWFEELSDSESLSEGSEYVAVGQRGAASVPFHVREKLGDGRYKVDFRTHIEYNQTRPVTLPRIYNAPYDGYDSQPSTYDAYMFVDKEGEAGKRIKAIAGELRIPGNFKFLKLSEADKEEGSLMCCMSNAHSEMPPIRLGKIDDIHLLFHEKTARLKVFNNGTDVYISSPVGEQRLSKKAALFDLISHHGFREKVAREILSHSEQKGNATYRTFYAPGYGLDKQAEPNRSTLAGGPSAAFQDDFADERGSETYGTRNSAITQYGGEHSYPVDQMSSQNTDPAVWDNWQNYQAEDFQNSMNVAQQAGAEGQKEVFDTSMISGMLKSVRQDSLVERHLGALVEALDALGRLLMNFYWHQEEFSDRYGKSDMPELEDSIRNAFEALGDITLFLKEKTIESPFDEGDLKLDDTAQN